MSKHGSVERLAGKPATKRTQVRLAGQSKSEVSKAEEILFGLRHARAMRKYRQAMRRAELADKIRPLPLAG